MTFAPVVVVESGGVPFTQVAEGVGAPSFTVVESGAFAITLVEAGAAPIALFNPDGSRYSSEVWEAVELPPTFPVEPSFAIERSDLGNYRHDFDPLTVKPVPTAAIYVGKGGDNAADGLTWATRVRSLKQGLVRARGLSNTLVTHLRIEAATYRYSDTDGSGVQDSFAGQAFDRHAVIEPCDSSGVVVTTGDIISIHDQVMPAFSLVSGSVYVSTYTTEVPSPGACDLSVLNAKGNPQALRYAPGIYANEAAIVAGVNAKAAEYGHGACFNDTVNKKYYVRLSDGRAPDSNLVVLRGSAASNGTNAQHMYLNGRFGGVQNIWLRNVKLWGGILYSPLTQSEGRNINAFFIDCASLYSSASGVTIDGGGTYTFLRHTSDDAYKDGFNYDQSSGLDPTDTGVLTVHELDCTADWCGNDNTGDASSNASSAHERARVVRVNTMARRTQNRAFHDILAAKSWNLGCIAEACRQTGVQSAGFVSGFSPNTGETAEMWLDGCQSVDNAYDLETYKGGKLYYRNMDVTGYVNESPQGNAPATY